MVIPRFTDAPVQTMRLTRSVFQAPCRLIAMLILVGMVNALQHALAAHTPTDNAAIAPSKWVSAMPSFATVKFGIDNLQELRFEPFRGKRVALVCNAASQTRFMEHTVRALLQAGTIQLRTILLPDPRDAEFIQASTPADAINGRIRIATLATTGRRPTPDMLDGCDIVVVDLQDIGIRPYPTIATLYGVLDACAEYGLPVVVLDRPNPLGGESVDGSVPDSSTPRTGFTPIPIPYLHGMTIGEIALMINGEGWLTRDPQTGTPRQCQLQVIKMRRWRRTLQWEQVRYHWVPTSPNVPTAAAVRGIAMLGLIGELDAVSIGIGTERPFALLGAPDFNDSVITRCRQLLARAGIQVEEVSFTPTTGAFAGQMCRGVSLVYPPNRSVPYYSLGLELLQTLAEHYAPIREKLRQPQYRQRLYRITGDRRFLDFETTDTLLAQSPDFQSRRVRYLLYP